MTKLEAIKELTSYAENSWGELNESFQIAIDCIQHCVDEEDSPCYGCDHSHCNNCLYGGRIPE